MSQSVLTLRRLSFHVKKSELLQVIHNAVAVTVTLFCIVLRQLLLMT